MFKTFEKWAKFSKVLMVSETLEVMMHKIEDVFPIVLIKNFNTCIEKYLLIRYWFFSSWVDFELIWRLLKLNGPWA